MGRFWTIRVGIHYRAIAVEDGQEMAWFWIGHHAEYDKILGTLIAIALLVRKFHLATLISTK